MPVLTAATITRLTAYNLSRNGYIVPTTDAGPLHQAACWSWAIAGNLVTVVDELSANSMYGAIMDDDKTVSPPVLRNINDHHDFYPNTGPEFTTIMARRVAAMGGNLAAQNEIKTAVVKVVAKQHQLIPVNDGLGVVYSLHMVTRSWYNWDHWAISVRLDDGRRMFIQTVTGTPLKFAADVIWDEGLPETIIGLADLTADHVAAIANIPVAPIRSARCRSCGTVHGYFKAVFNKWYRCNLCGTVRCPSHRGVARIDGTYPCGHMACLGTLEEKESDE